VAKLGLQVKKRLLFVLGIFCLIFLLLIVRVGYIQIVQGQTLKSMAYEQQTLGRLISPRRGTIYDRNGKKLAISASVDTIIVNPRDLEKLNISLEPMAKKLAEILEMDENTVLRKLSKKTRNEVIKEKVDKEIGDEVRRWIKDENIKGISVDEDTKRFYPHRNLASHIIGFTGKDNQGLDGIEAIMDKYLKGKPGRILSETDGAGRTMPLTPERRVNAQDGLDVVLTIDETIQYLAEKAIDRAIDENKVINGAMAIVMANTILKGLAFLIRLIKYKLFLSIVLTLLSLLIINLFDPTSIIKSAHVFSYECIYNRMLECAKFFNLIPL
jgi:stage V sporulation protein D (sporulation-specific penicillin-binding protein)